ncbi:MAG TPA: hypothetical protein VEG65_07490 [Candidatus Bathyarchaeia archaeon]|nr:hypothetical protein [Candidatus Bathyarchaeia archaeon]
MLFGRKRRVIAKAKSFLERSYISFLLGSKPIACSDFVIPVYLDSETLYGIWGTIIGGFSDAQQVTIKSSLTDTTQASAGGEASVNISAVKLGMETKRSSGQTLGREMQTSLTAYQTDNMLLNNLRIVLAELIKRFEHPPEHPHRWEDIEPSDFVELRGVFQPTYYGAAESLVYDIKLTGENKDDFRATTTLYSKYARDGSFTEIGYNELCLFGKVSRKLENGFPLSYAAPKTSGDKLFRASGGPDQIDGRVLVIVPIAIFV